MLVQALTVFLALIGTTLSCMSTGARVTYAMGRDKEVPEHFGMLHGESSRRIARFGRWRDFSGGRDRRRSSSTSPARPRSPATSSRRCRTMSGTASASSATTRGEDSAEPARRHPDQQLRHVPALHDDVRGRDGGVLRAPYVQRVQARCRSGLRPAREPALHAVLSGRTVLRPGHEPEGTVSWRWLSLRYGASTVSSTSCVRPRQRARRSS